MSHKGYFVEIGFGCPDRWVGRWETKLGPGVWYVGLGGGFRGRIRASWVGGGFSSYCSYSSWCGLLHVDRSICEYEERTRNYAKRWMIQSVTHFILQIDNDISIQHSLIPTLSSNISPHSSCKTRGMHNHFKLPNMYGPCFAE